MTCYGMTDRGKTRADNQDSFLIEQCEKVSCCIMALCDGMGGENAGGLASELSAKAFVNYLYHHIVHFSARVEDYPRLMREACEEANGMAWTYAGFGDELAGMGTTLVGAVMRRNGNGWILNVGDSRAYILHRKVLRQVTKDHSLVEELMEAGIINEAQAKVHPQRNVITRALGTDETVEPDLYQVSLSPGDSLLLCSDGLSNQLPEEEIRAVLMDAPNAEIACRDLMELTLSRKATDNISIVVWKR